MDSPDDTRRGIPGSDTLLSEILSVLKSINGHLEHQEQRISELSSKLTPFTEGQKDASLNFPLSGKAKHNPGLSTSTTRHRDLSILTSQPNDSVGNRNTSGWQATPFSDDSNPFSKKGPVRVTPTRADHGKKVFAESPKARNASVFKFNALSRSGTWSSLAPPPSSLAGGYDEEITESHDLTSYAKYPPPETWIITRTQGRALEVKYGSPEAQILWRSYVGDSWTIPPDGRIEMTFQQHILERLNETQAVLLLETLRSASSRLEYRGADVGKRGSFRVKDYDFDPDYEVSVAEYRADIPIGQVRRHRIKDRISGDETEGPQSAPWKRIM